MKRTKLADRLLPNYSRGEERMNTITHIIGAALGVTALIACVLKSSKSGSITNIISSSIYGLCMIALYSMSSIYHGMRPGKAKKVMQIIDHCTIYFLIAGSYTPIVLGVIRDLYPAIGWGLFISEWGLALCAAVFTAIDLHNYRVFSMICYIGMGWGIVLFLPQTYRALGATGFWLVFAGGIAYTIGAILYGLGKRRKWMHSVFHIFVVLGSLLQFLAIYYFAL